MTKIQSLAVITITFFVLAISGIMFLETYEDHIQKLFFSNFGQPDIIYYKLHFSFWPEVFFTINKINSSLPWYEIFLSAINIIALYVCIRDLKGNWFINTIFIFSILIPQLIFLNYTRVAIFAATVATIGILQSNGNKKIIGYLILLLVATSIRWQLSFYTILIVLALYLNLSNLKRLIWLPVILIIPLYIYIQNTSSKQIEFYNTESYIFSLNDSKNAKSILESDTQSLLIKEMTTRFIIPERRIINETSLSKITFKKFFEPAAISSTVKNFLQKILDFHKKPIIYLVIGYCFVLLLLYVFYTLEIYKYGIEHLIRIAIALSIIIGISILIRAVFYVIFPSMFIILIYVLNNNFFINYKQKLIALLMGLTIALLSILYSFELQKKVLPNQNLVTSIYKKLNELNYKKKKLMWDSQSVVINFKPIFRPITSSQNNYFIEEPYLNAESQIPNNNFKNYSDFINYMSNKSLWITDKERFTLINKYLKTFYKKEYSYTIIESFPYNKNLKVNKINNNIYESDTSILIIKPINYLKTY
jgi:hypothetical protein